MVSPQVGMTPTLPLFIIYRKSHGKEILLDEGRGDRVYGSVFFASHQKWTKRFALNAVERTVCCMGCVPPRPYCMVRGSWLSLALCYTLDRQHKRRICRGILVEWQSTDVLFVLLGYMEYRASATAQC